jgi:HK97 family phage major capsid protein/HK97 family phage prohead protease
MTKMKTMKIDSPLYREFTFERAAVDEEQRTVSVAFSSEEPVERWFGDEILDHSAGAADLKRLKSGGAVLWNHNPDDLIGVVENARIDSDDRRGRAVVRFADTPDAESVWQKVRQGVARHVSVGYRVNDLKLDEEHEGDATYRVTRWTPFEISIVSVPADTTVGVGRSAKEFVTMSEQDKTKPATKDKDPGVTRDDVRKAAAEAIRDEMKSAADTERKRVDALRKIGEEYGFPQLALQAIEAGKSEDELRTMILDERKTVVKPEMPLPTGGERKEDEKVEVHYRVGKMKAFRDEKAAFKAGQMIRAQFFGDEKAARWVEENVKTEFRALAGGINTKGGFLVPVEMDQAIIDLREEYGVARQLGRVVPMGSDTMQIPRRSGGVTAYYVGENTAITESDKSWDQVNLVARKLAVLSRMSSEVAEDAIINLADDLASEIAYAFAEAEDDAYFNGDGTSTYGGMIGLRSKLIDGNHAAGAVDVATATHDTFAKIDNDDLTKMMAALPRYALNGARWVCSQPAYALVFESLKLAGGGNTFSDIQAGGTPTFLGYPITISQKMPTSTGSLDGVVMLAFGNFSLGSTIGDRRGVMVDTDTSRYFEYDQIAIRGTERFDIVWHDLGDGTTAGPVVGLVGSIS